MQSMAVLYNLVACYILTDREPLSSYVFQISLCAQALLHMLYLLKVHPAFWVYNFPGTNVHAQIEENIWNFDPKSEKLAL